jgi:hypothetical protein
MNMRSPPKVVEAGMTGADIPFEKSGMSGMKMSLCGAEGPREGVWYGFLQS